MESEIPPNTSPEDDKAVLLRGDALADRLLGLMLLTSAALLVAGWFMPVMTVRTLMIFYDEVSIVEGALRLIESGDYLLVAIILTFTIVFPVCKLILAFLVWRRPEIPRGDLSRALRWVELFSKWSMLDVFVVALVIVIVKISLVSDVTIHAGLYVFCTAVVLSMFTVWRITQLAHREIHRQPSSNSPAP
ncbi:paraquat-inducible protein A [Pelagibius sp. Alg239-R121]|uniref:paraquat-inducible protein A n=1 Tax=Pelagibius sp. Alg239-R121 TaxID=2993448 RepID=UPI0024A66070|nr:paraquat-inducible protein A [Pelagibius sp. Alg239-R121]